MCIAMNLFIWVLLSFLNIHPTVLAVAIMLSSDDSDHIKSAICVPRSFCSVQWSANDGQRFLEMSSIIGDSGLFPY